jgi:hypothetical protein
LKILKAIFANAMPILVKNANLTMAMGIYFHFKQIPKYQDFHAYIL